MLCADCPNLNAEWLKAQHRTPRAVCCCAPPERPTLHPFLSMILHAVTASVRMSAGPRLDEALCMGVPPLQLIPADAKGSAWQAPPQIGVTPIFRLTWPIPRGAQPIRDHALRKGVCPECGGKVDGFYYCLNCDTALIAEALRAGIVSERLLDEPPVKGTITAEVPL